MPEVVEERQALKRPEIADSTDRGAGKRYTLYHYVTSKRYPYLGDTVCRSHFSSQNAESDGAVPFRSSLSRYRTRPHAKLPARPCSATGEQRLAAVQGPGRVSAAVHVNVDARISKARSAPDAGLRTQIALMAPRKLRGDGR